MKDTYWIIKVDCVGRQGWVGGMGVEVTGEIKKKCSSKNASFIQNSERESE